MKIKRTFQRGERYAMMVVWCLIAKAAEISAFHLEETKAFSLMIYFDLRTLDYR